MVHPRDRHLESQNRASANTHSISSTDTRIASTDLSNFIAPLTNSKHTLTSKVTLDKMHHSHIQKFNDDKDKLSKTKKEIKKMRAEHGALTKRPFQQLSESEMKRFFFLESEIDTLTNKVEKWKNNDDMTDYFMNTGTILFEYYANLNSISKGGDDLRKRSLDSYQPSDDTTEQGGYTVVDFFRKHKSRQKSTAASGAGAAAGKDTPATHDVHDSARFGSCLERLDPDGNQTEPNTDASSEDNAVPLEGAEVLLPTATPPQPRPTAKTPYTSRQVLLQQYLEQTEPHLVADNQTYVAGSNSEVDECPDCGTERVLYQHEACLVCPNEKCMRTDNILVDSNVPAYKDSSRETTSYYSYKRINHFNEWLAQFQAKETTDIADDVYNQIYLELKKERISNMAVVTPVKMKEILKRLKLNKYYEHIPHITNRINGQPAPVITRAMEEKLRSMFKEIQGPFMKHCPADRKNFLSYSYVLHKFCQLLELDDFLQCFQLLKSREKLHVQDTIWEKICKDLHWEFIKSV